MGKKSNKNKRNKVSSSKFNNEKKSNKLSIISLLKKIFSIKILSLMICIITAFISYLAFDRSDTKDKKEEIRINEELRQKELEEIDKTHEYLILSFQCIPVMKNEYNADIILPSNSTADMIVQTVNIINGGRKTAKNTELEICIKNDFKFMLIQSDLTEEVKDTIYPQQNLAKWDYRGIKPNKSVMPMFIITRKDNKRFYNGQNFSMCYTLSCDDKAHPIEIDVNYNIYLCNSLSEYEKIIKNRVNDNQEYFKKKDFIIFHYTDTDGNGNHKIYKVETKIGGYIFNECLLKS